MKDFQQPAFALFYTTFETKEQALPVIHELLKNNLIVCANFFPIDSVYRWKGKIEEGKEIACFLKTLSTKSEDLKKFLLAYHPYEIPCLIDIHVESLSSSYLKWALREAGSCGKPESK